MYFCQWIAKLIEHDNPSTFLDQQLRPTLPNTKLKHGASVEKSLLSLVSRVRSSNEESASQQKFVDLTILSFPHNDTPWFKAS
jgi:hypothetical protein